MVLFYLVQLANTTVIISQARYTIGEILADQNDKNSKISLLYSKLNSSLQYFDDLRVAELFQIMQSREQGESDGRNKSVPRAPLVIVDLRESVDLMAELIYIFTDEIFSFGQDLPLFSTRTQWVIQRGPFLRLITPYLHSAHESGLFMRWRQLFSLKEQFKKLQKVRDRILDSEYGYLSKVSKNDNILGYLLNKKFMQGQSTKTTAISLNYIFVVIIMYLYCIGFCSGALIFEILWNRKFFYFFILKILHHNLKYDPQTVTYC